MLDCRSESGKLCSHIPSMLINLNLRDLTNVSKNFGPQLPQLFCFDLPEYRISRKWKATSTSRKGSIKRHRSKGK